MPPTATTSPKRLTLSRALHHSRMTSAWKNTVRKGLRDQDLPDLHDHLDVHWRLRQIVSRLHTEAIDFTYRVRDPEIARLEKSNGINRRTVIPAPSDALVLQAIVDAIGPQVLRAQPTSTSYYARSHQPRSMADIDSTFPSDWLLLWKEGQRRIWEFTQTHDVIVVTDIANYFDAIPMGQLRNRIASLGQFDEVLLDFLFSMLGQLIWRPEYLPPAGTGLPQIQFDAPRLLAHAYLYEADRFLRRACRGDVVRWMDDISFGVPDIGTAKRVLRELDELLASLGVRLNTGKTKILTSAEGVAYFRMLDNRNLSVIQEILDLRKRNAATRLRVAAYLKRYWRRVWKGDRTGYWEKIVKRFFTLFTQLDDPYLQAWVPRVIASRPSLRRHAFRYYGRLGYTRHRFKQIAAFIAGPDCLDDASMCSAAVLLTDWHMPANGVSAREAVDLAQRLPSTAKTLAVGFVAGLWLLSKYGSNIDVGTFARRHERIWRTSQWASRQVAAATSRMNDREARAVADTIAMFGLLEGEGVLAHLAEIRRMSGLSRSVRRYVEHPSDPYPLPKFLVALSLLRGSLPDGEKTRVRNVLLQRVADQTYAMRIQAMP